MLADNFLRVSRYISSMPSAHGSRESRRERGIAPLSIRSVIILRICCRAGLVVADDMEQALGISGGAASWCATLVGELEFGRDGKDIDEIVSFVVMGDENL